MLKKISSFAYNWALKISRGVLGFGGSFVGGALIISAFGLYFGAAGIFAGLIYWMSLAVVDHYFVLNYRLAAIWIRSHNRKRQEA